MYLPNNTKKIRKIYGVTQSVFASALGVTLDQEKSYELGRTKPDGPYLERLSNLSGFTLGELLDKDLSEDEILRRKDFSVKITPTKIGGEVFPTANTENGQPNIDYKQLYIESLQSRLQSAEEEIKDLRTTLKSNLATIQVLLQGLSNQVTAQSEVTMKALDRVFDQPEGTLGVASDKLEVKLWERIAQTAGRAGIPLQINVSS